MNTWLKVVFIHCVNTQPDKVFSYTVHTLVDLVVWTTGHPSCGPHYVYKCDHQCSSYVHLVFVYFVYTQILNTRCTQLCTMVGRLAVVHT